jgi:sterol desaturase/sphingolipid hydroxylase (fatty acid hydroxylase superfamily)
MTITDAAFHVFPDVFLFDGGRYVIGTLIMSLIIAAVLASPWRVRKLQTRQPKRADYVRELVSSLRSVVVYALVATPALWLTANGYTAPYYGDSAPWPVTLAYVGALLVAHDSWFYWMHRIIHTRALFARIHRHHHRSVTPTPFTAYSFSAIEAVLEAVFVSIWVSFVSTPFTAMFIFLGIVMLRNVMGHAGVELMPRGFADHWFWGLFATTTHHDLHHAGSLNHNFGLYFTVWDRLMGTEHPRYREIFREVTSRPPLRAEAVHTAPAQAVAPAADTAAAA